MPSRGLSPLCWNWVHEHGDAELQVELLLVQGDRAFLPARFGAEGIRVLGLGTPYGIGNKGRSKNSLSPAACTPHVGGCGPRWARRAS